MDHWKKYIGPAVSSQKSKEDVRENFHLKLMSRNWTAKAVPFVMRFFCSL